MTAASTNKSGYGPTVNVARERRRYRLWAMALIALGAFLLAGQLGLLSGPLAWAFEFWPLLLVLLGFLLMRGRLPPRFASPSFAVDRGDYQSAHLHLSAGLADAHVSAFAGASQLAVGQFPGWHGPRVRAEGSSAQLILDRRSASPFLAGPWTISLVKGLPWSFTLRSGAGHFNLNLRDLTVTSLDLQSAAGDVDLTLPAMGQGEMNLRLGLGDLTVRLPHGMAVKIKLASGPVSRAYLDDHRFIQTQASEWVTPNFSTSPQRFTLFVSMAVGDLRLV